MQRPLPALIVLVAAGFLAAGPALAQQTTTPGPAPAPSAAPAPATETAPAPEAGPNVAAPEVIVPTVLPSPRPGSPNVEPRQSNSSETVMEAPAPAAGSAPAGAAR